MSSSGHADKCLWFIGAFEQLLRQIYWGDAILVSVNDQNRDMNVTNREVRTKLVEHQPTYRQHPIMHGGYFDCRRVRRVEHESGCFVGGSQCDRDAGA
jgi:hypothetical protein